MVALVLTDNQGNGHAFSLLHSCRFPLAAVIIEMSEELKARAMTAEVRSGHSGRRTKRLTP